MITYFEFGNFKSFKEKVHISFEKEKTVRKKKIFNENSLSDNGKIISYSKDGINHVILNSGIIFGPNASGKSNILNAIETLKKVVSINQNKQMIKLSPFKFVEKSKKDNEVTFEVGMIKQVKKQKYYITYALAIDATNDKVTAERLSYHSLEKKEDSIIFERIENSLTELEERLKRVFDYVIKMNNDDITLLNMLILKINRGYYSKEVETLEYQIIQEVYEQLTSDIVSLTDTHSKSMQKVAQRLDDDPEYKKALLNLLSEFDFAINDIEAIDITYEAIDDLLDLNMEENTRDQLLKRLNLNKSYTIRTYHEVNDKEYYLEINEESNGTKKFLRDFLVIYDVLQEGKLLLIDEVENGYHNKIQDELIRRLLEGSDESRCQFLITTHNTNYLSSNLFDASQIILVEKDREKQTSEAYTLEDFNDLPNYKRWQQMYQEGLFGAVPEVY